MVPRAIAALPGAALHRGLWNRDDRLPSAPIGRPVPEFALPPIEGCDNGLSSEELRGAVTIANISASWCIPCRAENPLRADLAKTGAAPICAIAYKDVCRCARSDIFAHAENTDCKACSMRKSSR